MPNEKEEDEVKYSSRLVQMNGTLNLLYKGVRLAGPKPRLAKGYRPKGALC